MRVSITQAEGQLADLVRRAEAGEEVVLIRHDKPVATITAIKDQLTPEELSEKRRRALETFREEVAKSPASPGPDAAHAADFLYGPDGLPK